MAYWYHRNPLKATTPINFDLHMVAAKPEAVQICSDLKRIRAELIKLLSDLASNPAHVEDVLNQYLALLFGFIEALDQRGGDSSKLRHLIMFKWTHSLLGNIPIAQQDTIFEVISILQETAIWLMKYASNLSNMDTINEEEAKKIYKALLKAAGLFKFAQSQYFEKLLEQPTVGSDLDSRISNAYVYQCLAEAQEVTVARAIELKHSSALISALCIETARLFSAAASSIKSLETSKLAKWEKYFELKTQIYDAYAYCYHGDNLLALEKCGEAIRSLMESEKLLNEAIKNCKEYSKTKGVGVGAKPETHAAFRKLQALVIRTKEKCERENGMIFHQKVAIERPQIDTNATHGFVVAEDFKPPSISPLWTKQAYSAFDLSVNLKDKKKQSKKKQDSLPEVKEKNVNAPAQDAKTESGCIIQ